jgi:CRISPR type III-B/RAMP module-associated protein Cmr3
MSLLKVIIKPIDPLQFGDNRSARAGEDHVIRDQDPSPLTIYGAIGARIANALGLTSKSREWPKEIKSILGPFQDDILQPTNGENFAELAGYCYIDGRHQKAWFPRPLHYRITGKKDSKAFWLPKLYPEDTLPNSLSSAPYKGLMVEQAATDDEDLMKEIEEEFYISVNAIEQILSNEALDGEHNCNDDILFLDGLYLAEHRAGLGMDNHSNTTKTGLLFSRPYRRFRQEFNSDYTFQMTQISAWFKIIKQVSAETLLQWNGIGFFGGDRRRAWFSFSHENDLPLSPVLTGILNTDFMASNGYLVYLLTPAINEDSENNFLLKEENEPVSAIFGKPQAMSGWISHKAQVSRNSTQRDKQHPRAIRTLIPAGSVIFYRWPDRCSTQEQRKNLIKELWMQPINQKFKNAGLGRMLLGAW